MIRWHYVVSNFAQVLACLFYIYYIFERFCVPVFRDFSSEYVTPERLLLSIFSSIMPGTLVLFIGTSHPSASQRHLFDVICLTSSV